MKRIAVLLAFFTLASTQLSKASHLLGGEITWECITSGNDQGKLVFTGKLYRACGGAGLPGTMSINNPLYAANGGAASITASRTELNDISPDCFADTAEMDCLVNGRNANAVQEGVYVSSATSVYGTPATGGSAFWWSSCCRPAASRMQNINGSGYWLRAVMFPYTDPGSGNTLSLGSSSGGPSCYDSSPRFVERPATIICTGYEFTYNHNAVDSELDSLSYSWTPPMQSASNPVTWRAGYSVVNQLPTSYHNSNNKAATLNSLTGEIKFTTYTPQGGYHSTAVKVTSYKCRQKVAEIIRDIPVVLLACPPTPTTPPLANTPPEVVFKWAANATQNIPLPAGDTVMAGDEVNFYITSTDIQFLPGFIGQTNFLLPSGSQFGARYSDTVNGCKYPPCATLDTNSNFWNDSAIWWEGEYGIQTRFNWKTDCNHLAQVNACFTRSNTYNFVFKVLDNWCPAPGMNFQTFSVTVLAPPAIEPPKFTCSRVNSNGDVILNWTQPVTRQEDTLNSFQQYLIFRAVDTAGAPFDTIHVVQNIDSLTWTDTSANTLNSLAKFYVVRGISSCNGQGDSVLSDTISGMKLVAQSYNAGNSVYLNWTDYDFGNRWGENTTREYYVNQIVGTDTTIVDTVTESWDSLDVTLCYPTQVDYFISVIDTTPGFGCTSMSNFDGDQLGDNTPPPPVVIDSISYDANNQLHIGWYSPSPDVGTYYVYKNSTLIDSFPANVNAYQYNLGANDTCSMEFAISARDTCGNLGQAGLGQYSMCSKIVNVSRCNIDQNITIGWSTYNPGWTQGNGTQEIWRSVNGGPYVMIDTVGSVTTQYMDTAIQGNTTYDYRIRSWELGKNRSSWTYETSYTIDRLIDSTIVDPPDLRCISWLNDSTIRLDWKKPYNPGGNFDSYHIYHSTDGVSFTHIDSIKGIFSSDTLAIDSLGYTHISPDTTSNYYRVKSRSGCFATDYSKVSRTLKAIELRVNPTRDSVNRLDWTQITNTQTGPSYSIYRDSAGVGTTNYGNETYDDIFVVCQQDVQYYVELPDSDIGCSSTSKIVDGEFLDDTPPSKQFVDSVSMYLDTNNLARIGWSDNASGDVVKYYVVQCTGGGTYTVLDTMDASLAKYYEDLANAPLTGITQYSVVAEDSCGNNKLNSGDFNCHSTLFVTPVMDFCDQSIKLSWNPYESFASGTGVSYVIYVQENGGTWTELGRSETNDFKHEGIVDGNNYCYYVQAWEDGGAGPFSASSAVICLDAKFIIRPSYAYMRYVTVEEENVIRMSMEIDLNSNIGEYWINRTTDTLGDYDLIATISVPDPITPADSVFSFQDLEVETDVRPYYYRIDVADPCGEIGRTSNVGSSIYLTVKPDNERYSNKLTFNKYAHWTNGVQEYEVYRGVTLRSMEKIKPIVVSKLDETEDVTHTKTHITYVDDVSKEGVNGDGQFYYKVVAIEGTPTFKDKERAVSESNVATSMQLPKFFAPTGFTPNGDGLNDVFRPQGSFHDAKAYSMEIYNRWGEMVYLTESYEAGWDGTYNGKESPSGAYVFVVRYTAADGTEYEDRGTVTLAR